jgi:hypothetical protein
MSFVFRPIKYTFWNTFGDNTPNDFIATYIEPHYGNPCLIKIRRRLATEIGCKGIRRGVEWYVNDTECSMWSERHAVIGYAEVLAPVTVVSKAQALAVCEFMELKQ